MQLSIATTADNESSQHPYRLLGKLSARAATLCLAVAGVLAATPASAGIVVLNFAGLNGDAYESPLDYYNGGTGSLGSGPGTNYGVSFGADALSCSGQPGGACNTALVPGGPGANALFFLTGPGDIMNVAAGFDTGFSFYYSAPIYTGSVQVYSGLDGSGTLLASLSLALTTNGAGTDGCQSTNYCPYVATGVSFDGIAKSAVFTGTANYIGFADITLGSVVAGVPEPATLTLFGLGLAAAGVLKRNRASAIKREA